MENPQTRSSALKNSSKSAVQWSSEGRGVSCQKSCIKENTKTQEFKLHTEERAFKRALFNYSVATKLYVIELRRKQEEKLQKMIEEEEIRLLRKEMIPRAQLMPYFDRPFFPQRSKTVSKEPCLHMMSSKCWNCLCNNELHSFQTRQALKPIK